MINLLLPKHNKIFFIYIKLSSNKPEAKVIYNFLIHHPISLKLGMIVVVRFEYKCHEKG